MGEVIQMKPKAYYFDINKKFDDVINSVQFDKNSRFIEVNFLSNSQAVNLTGYRATIRAIKPDKTEIFDELKEIDASIGKYELELTEQLNAVAGDVLAQFEIYGEGESLFTTSQFKIGVSKSLSREKTTSSDELGVLVNVMAEAQQYKNNFVKMDAKIDDEIAKTNAQLSVIDNKKADKTEIGSPLVANSMSEMIDVTKVYVNTSDGHWYSHNGTHWIDGGIYNSQGVGIDSIEPIQLKGGIQSYYIYNYPHTYIGGKFINSQGIIESASSGGMAKIKVEGDKTYSIWKPSAQYSSSSGLGLFMNADSEIISSFILSDYISGTHLNVKYITIKTPIDCAYICFNVKLASHDDSTSAIACEGDEIPNQDSISKIFNKGIVDEYIRNKFNEFINEIKITSANLYSKEKHYVPNKYINIDGEVSEAVDWGYAKISVESEKSYSLQLPSGIYTGSIGSLAYYKDNQKLSFVYPASQLTSGKYNGVNYLTFTTPSECNYVCITCKRGATTDKFDNSDTLIIVAGETIPENFTYENYINEIEGFKLLGTDLELSKEVEMLKKTLTNHPLNEKKWVVVGDSLTEKNIRATKNYHDYIAEETGIKVINFGKSGTGYKRTEESGTAFYQRIKTIPTDVDIVTFFGSGNDLSLTLGEVEDTGTDTICGCINTTLDNLYDILPTVKVGVITPCPWGGYPPHILNNKMALYSDALIEICKRRGIPYLDLYRSSNMRPWNTTFKDLMYKRDDGGNVHPDEDGHEFMYRRFLSFIESL